MINTGNFLIETAKKTIMEQEKYCTKNMPDGAFFFFSLCNHDLAHACIHAEYIADCQGEVTEVLFVLHTTLINL